jgi:acyl carrier protein
MSDLLTMTQEVAEIFRDRLKISVPSLETDVIATGLLDSMGFVNLLAHLEERFGIHVTIETIEPDNFRSITRIAVFVCAHRNGGAELNTQGEL